MTCLAGMGGSAIVAGDTARGLAERGHEVHMVSDRVPFAAGRDLVKLQTHSDRETHVDTTGVLWHTASVSTESAVLGGNELTYARFAAVLSSVVLSVDPEIINVHYAVPAAFAAAGVRNLVAPNARLVVSFHGTDASNPPPELVSLTSIGLTAADAVTACSPWLADLVRRQFNVLDVQVTPNWVRPGAGKLARTERLALRREMGMCRGEKLLIHASNFRPVKQAVHTLDALVGALQGGHDARLVLVGDGEELPAVLAEAERVGLADRVVAMGPRSDAPQLIAAADALILPSASESFSLVTLEAAVAGVPTVGYNVAGMPYAVRDGLTGLLAQPEYRSELGLMTRAVLDPAMRRVIAVEGPRHARRFSRDAMLDRLEMVLDPRMRLGRSVPELPGPDSLGLLPQLPNEHSGPGEPIGI